MQTHRQHWGLPQWVAFLRGKEIPIMPRSKLLIEALDVDSVSPLEMAGMVMRDPFLALRILRMAERRRSATLEHDTTTILGAVQQVGARGLAVAASDSTLCDEENAGLVDCEARAVLSASIALNWAGYRVDVSPQEVAFAALLSEIGELMMWAFAPELPQAALGLLRRGEVTRNVEAQQLTMGFGYKQLSLGLIEAWELPPLIAQLVRGADTPRANIARIASDTARHLQANPRNPALPSDVVAVHAFVPNANWSALLSALPIDEDYGESMLAVLQGNGEDVSDI